MGYVKSIVLMISLLTISCTNQTNKESAEVLNPTDFSVEIPDVTVAKSLLKYDNKTSLWTSNSQL